MKKFILVIFTSFFVPILCLSQAPTNLAVNNVFNTLYLAELNTNALNLSGELYTPDQSAFYTKNKGYFGFGRTWNFGIKFSF